MLSLTFDFIIASSVIKKKNYENDHEILKAFL